MSHQICQAENAGLEKRVRTLETTNARLERRNGELIQKIEKLKIQLDDAEFVKDLAVLDAELSILLDRTTTRFEAAGEFLSFLSERFQVFQQRDFDRKKDSEQMMDVAICMAYPRKDGGTEFRPTRMDCDRFKTPNEIPSDFRRLIKAMSFRIFPDVDMEEETLILDSTSEIIRCIGFAGLVSSFGQAIVIPCIYEGWCLAILVILRRKKHLLSRLNIQRIESLSKVFARHVRRIDDVCRRYRKKTLPTSKALKHLHTEGAE